MLPFKFDEDISLDEVFNRHKIDIYDRVVESIRECYLNTEIEEVEVITITIKNFEYSIKLTRPKFIEALKNAIPFYEEIECYEKCKLCLEMIAEIKKEP